MKREREERIARLQKETGSISRHILYDGTLQTGPLHLGLHLVGTREWRPPGMGYWDFGIALMIRNAGILRHAHCRKCKKQLLEELYQIRREKGPIRCVIHDDARRGSWISEWARECGMLDVIYRGDPDRVEELEEPGHVIELVEEAFDPGHAC